MIRQACRGCGLTFIGPGAFQRYADHTWVCDEEAQRIAEQFPDVAGSILTLMSSMRAARG